MSTIDCIMAMAFGTLFCFTFAWCMYKIFSILYDQEKRIKELEGRRL